MGRRIQTLSPLLVLMATVAAMGFLGAVASAETPLVVFDLPLTIECRDVTPKRFEESYQRKIVEAVVKISPQLLAGEEKDLKRLHYEISTEQQMPVVSYAPSSQLATDVAGGTMAIQTSDHHGQLLVHYLITPAAGDGRLTADLKSSHAQYTLLAPKQILVAAGTIQRGCGVYYDLRPSTQDTLQKQREFACLFAVPATWRATYITVQCNASGAKRGLIGETEVNCGMGMLSVGLYMQDDGEAMALAYDLAKRQQQYLDRLTEEAKGRAARGQKSDWLSVLFAASKRTVSSGTVMRAKRPTTGVGATLLALQAQQDIQNREMKSSLIDVDDGSDEVSAAKAALRRLNGSQ